MRKRPRDTDQRSKDDTFMTTREEYVIGDAKGHALAYLEIHNRTRSVVRDLISSGVVVWRYKIEDTLMDSKLLDEMELLGGLR